MLELERVVGWRTKMQENLHKVQTTPFEWGMHDCALFASDHVQAITGVDVGSSFRGKYTTPEGALEALKEAGCENLLEFCKDKFQEIHPSQARVGDLLVLASDFSGMGLSVVLGETIGVLTLKGYGILKRSDKKVVTGFKIG